jgi:hypothetical protein
MAPSALISSGLGEGRGSINFRRRPVGPGASYYVVETRFRLRSFGADAAPRLRRMRPHQVPPGRRSTTACPGRVDLLTIAVDPLHCGPPAQRGSRGGKAPRQRCAPGADDFPQVLGSRMADSVVEPTRSQNITVSCRRSALSSGLSGGVAVTWRGTGSPSASSEIAASIFRRCPSRTPMSLRS